MLTIFALSLTKVGGLLPSLDQPSALHRTGWSFRAVMKDANFLDKELAAEPAKGAPRLAGCFIGRIAPNKGFLDLLHAWEDVTHKIPDAKLVVAGRCQSTRIEIQLRRTIERLGLLDSVDYRGYVSAEEKERLLTQSILFVYPSYEEGWSVSVMEAASHGVVPVLYDLPAYEYLPFAEIKTPIGDWRSLAELIVALLKDPSHVVLLADRLRLAVMAYNKQTIAREQAAVFERLSGQDDPVAAPTCDS
jgi:glycosyltransferase involved in cell wall biosynthesis